MNTIHAVLLPFALLTSTGLAAQVEPPPIEQPATEIQEVAKPKFDWPVPGKVVVTDTVSKGGKTVKMRYTLQTRRPESGKGVRVQYRDFAYLEVEGQDVTAPRYQQMLAPALAMTSAIPDYLISADGQYEQNVGVEEMIERVERLLAKVRKSTSQEAAKRAEMLRTPQFKKVIQASMSKYWNAWVGAWLEWDIPPGKTVVSDSEVPFLKLKMPGSTRLTHHGAVEGKPGFVKLSIRTVGKAEGEQVQVAMRAFLKSLGAPPMGDTKEEEKFETFEIESRVEVVTRLDNLRPTRVETEQIVRLKQKGAAKPFSKVERHEYEFDWSKATAAKPAK